MSASASARRRLILARLLLAITIVATTGGIFVAILDARATGSPGTGLSLSDVTYLIAFITFPIVGYAIASRRPDHAIGWLLLAIGTVFGLDLFLAPYAMYALHGGFGGPEWGRLAAALDEPLWVVIVPLPVTFLFLIFPTGHLPSARWRWFARALGLGLALLFLGIQFGPGQLDNFPGVRNPLGIEALRPVRWAVTGLVIVLPVGIIASLIALAQRFRRSTGVERLQLRVVLVAAAIVALFYVIAIPLGIAYGWERPEAFWVEIVLSLAIMSFALIPISIGVAVLRYRLFDIEVVLNRAVLYGVLALFITAVYVAIVVGIGALVGSRGDPVLSAIAAAVVALAFQPARHRARRFANRLVYGKRATPYELLAEFSGRIGGEYAIEEVLPRMARILGEGTGARRADVWIRVGAELRRAAVWQGTVNGDAVALTGADGLPSIEDTDIVEAVRHRGELLGALSVAKPRGEDVGPTEQQLLRDLASHAGLVLRNARLIEELRASRQRLVAAQDDERRRLERNIHDGAQQQLVALSVKLRLAENLARKDPDKAAAIMAEVRSETQQALEDLRDLARGIYPPLLADQGLAAALEAQARKAVLPVAVSPNGVGRYPQEVEAAAYFCVLEALQNVAKYAEARSASVRLSEENGDLVFAVTDDGRGFDPVATPRGSGLQNMADRLDALGGRFEIVSAPGEGTTVTGRIPVQRVAAAQASSRRSGSNSDLGM
jgi:signal transduction histidine kinase